jgi:hypothetical protein
MPPTPQGRQRHLVKPGTFWAAGHARLASGGDSRQQHVAAVLQKLTGIVSGVMGSAVPPQQPLMEVGSLLWAASGVCCAYICAAVELHTALHAAADRSILQAN